MNMKLEEFKQKSKKDRTSRVIVGLTLLGLSVFGLFRKQKNPHLLKTGYYPHLKR